MMDVDHPLLTAIRASYGPRVADGQLHRALQSAPVVLVEGPRACGKTWTGGHAARSAVLLDAPEAAALTSAMARQLFLEGLKPKLLDEYHLAPGLWNPIRRAADELAQPGQFILTGSAVPPDSATRHTGAGRVRRVRMRPVSLAESGESTAQVSLGELFDSGEVAAAAPDAEPDMFDLACRGGWPALVHLSGTEAQPASSAGRPARIRESFRSIRDARPAGLRRRERRPALLLPRQHRLGGRRHHRAARRRDCRHHHHPRPIAEDAEARFTSAMSVCLGVR